MAVASYSVVVTRVNGSLVNIETADFLTPAEADNFYTDTVDEDTVINIDMYKTTTEPYFPGQV